MILVTHDRTDHRCAELPKLRYGPLMALMASHSQAVGRRPSAVTGWAAGGRPVGQRAPIRVRPAWQEQPATLAGRRRCPCSRRPGRRAQAMARLTNAVPPTTSQAGGPLNDHASALVTGRGIVPFVMTHSGLCERPFQRGERGSGLPDMAHSVTHRNRGARPGGHYRPGHGCHCAAERMASRAPASTHRQPPEHPVPCVSAQPSAARAIRRRRGRRGGNLGPPLSSTVRPAKRRRSRDCRVCCRRPFLWFRAASRRG